MEKPRTPEDREIDGVTGRGDDFLLKRVKASDYPEGTTLDLGGGEEIGMDEIEAVSDRLADAAARPTGV